MWRRPPRMIGEKRPANELDYKWRWFLLSIYVQPFYWLPFCIAGPTGVLWIVIGTGGSVLILAFARLMALYACAMLRQRAKIPYAD
jgi:hypothetical protein